MKIIDKGMVYDLFTTSLLFKTFSMVSQVTGMKIVCKSYHPRNLMYQLTTSELKKLSVFIFYCHVFGTPLFKSWCRPFIVFFSMEIPFQLFLD